MRDTEHLAQLVGNEDDGRAVLDQCDQGLEQVLHFARGEHRGRLIQNEDGGLSIQGFEDLDALAQPDGKLLDQGLWINVEMILRGELAYMLSRPGARPGMVRTGMVPGRG